MSIEFNRLIRMSSSARAADNTPKTKIALLGDSTLQFLHKAITAHGQLESFPVEIWEAEFGQIERQVFDAGSDLYAFEPEIVVLAITSKKLQKKFYQLNDNGKSKFSTDTITWLSQIVEAISATSRAKILLFNLEEIDDSVFGNFANKSRLSFLNQIRRLNLAIMEMAEESGNLFVIDVAALHQRFGRENAYAPNIYISTDLVHSLNFTAAIAKSIINVVGSLSGRFKKCLILDLDNTLWGGVIGDDGVENIELGDLGIGKAYVELQQWIKALKDRGIILAICSKNNEETAKEPFLRHPDMVLRLEDIAVFVANWENKADNIRYIQEVLNIGFDSMVFLDDNPVERQLVKENLPQVTVPDLPDDPATYLEFLYGEGLFETASYSSTDADRTKQYQEEAGRKSLSQKFTNVPEFLRSLEMRSFVRPFREFDMPRVAQLSQRSNQFNLRTVRYTEEDIRNLAASQRHATFAFDLSDKFGDNGLIAVVVLEKRNMEELFIDTWLMSCRVLKRGMEHFVLDTLVRHAAENGFTKVVGEYIPTAKNGMVASHYADLGFLEDGGMWYLGTSGFVSPEYFIATQIDGRK